MTPEEMVPESGSDMDNSLEPELVKIVEAIRGCDGGSRNPVVLPSGGVALKLTAFSLI